METQRLITRAERFERISSAENRQSLEEQIHTVSTRLQHPRLADAIPGLDHPVGERYQRLLLTWDEFQNLITGRSLTVLPRWNPGP